MIFIRSGFGVESVRVVDIAVDVSTLIALELLEASLKISSVL